MAVQEKDDLIAELRTKLLEVRPKQFALAGAAGQMSLEDMVMAGEQLQCDQDSLNCPSFSGRHI